MTFLKRVGAAWERWCFEPHSPIDLAVSRIVFNFGVLAWYSITLDFSKFATAYPALWQPNGVIQFLGLPLFDEPTLAVIQWIWRVALIGSGIGLFTRTSQVISLIAGFYLLALPGSFGHNTYGQIYVPAMILIGMAFARSGDCLSVDSLIRRLRTGQRPDLSPNARYGWPIQWARFVCAICFFVSGISKFRIDGLDFMFGTSVRDVFRTLPYFSAWTEHSLLRDSIGGLGTVTWFPYWLLGVIGVIFEAGYPVMLFSKRSRFIILPLVLGFMVSELLILVPSFFVLMFCQAYWLPWTAIGEILRGTRPLPLLKRPLRLGLTRAEPQNV